MSKHRIPQGVRDNPPDPIEALPPHPTPPPYPAAAVFFTSMSIVQEQAHTSLQALLGRSYNPPTHPPINPPTDCSVQINDRAI